VLGKPGVFLSKRVGEHSPGAWIPADTKRRHQALTPAGWDGAQREAFSSVKPYLFSLQDSLGQQCPAALAAGSHPARHKQDG